MLAAVQHAGRESVEFFEVLGAKDSWRIEWRGCVLAMPSGSFNDVDLFADGGFIVSHTGAADRPAAVYRWRAADGFKEIPGTRGTYINGVLLAPGDRQFYANDTPENETRLFDLATGRRLAAVKVSSPDNLAWGPGGRLLIASFDMAAGPSFPDCFKADRGACVKPYRILSFTKTLTNRQVVHEGGSALMGASSIGVISGDELLVGSAGGDRLLRVYLGRGSLVQKGSN